MAANLENQLVYLTLAGANRLFSSDCGRNMIGLPVIPTDPTLVNGTIVYGDTFTEHNGEYIGGCNSQDTFTTQRPSDEQIEAAKVNFEAHMEMLTQRFGPQERRKTDVNALKGKTQVSPIPTLEQRAERRENGGTW